jgi:hypothetical protein
MRSFGLFMGVIVLVNYCLVLTVFAAGEVKGAQAEAAAAGGGGRGAGPPPALPAALGRCWRWCCGALQAQRGRDGRKSNPDPGTRRKLNQVIQCCSVVGGSLTEARAGHGSSPALLNTH